MTRSVLNQAQFTPFGLWIRQYLRDSRDGISVTNLDYIIEDFRQKKIMLLEEKQNSGSLNKGQLLTFKVLNRALSRYADQGGYEYWGFYVLRFKNGADMPGPGMTLNNVLISGEQLADHLNFIRRHCDPYDFQNRTFTPAVMAASLFKEGRRGCQRLGWAGPA